MAGPNVLNFGSKVDFGSKVVFTNGDPLTLPSYAGASPPGTPTAGDLYYNSSGNTVEYYNGTSWVSVGTVTLTGQALTQNDIIIGNASNLSAAAPVTGDISLTFSAGNAVSALTATSNSTLTTLLALSLPYSQLTGTPDLSVYANTSLSNLTSTAINQTLSPNADVAFSLGGPSNRWSNLLVDVAIEPASGNYRAQIDFTNRILYAQNGGGVTSSVDWNNRRLIYTDGSTIILDWANLQLKDSAGTTQLTWSTSGVDINKLSADLNANSFKITSLANGTNPNDAVNYSQLSAISSGLVWQGPINDPDLVDDDADTPPVTPVYSLTYIIGASGTGAFANGGSLAGHAVWWDGANWIDISTGNIAVSGSGTPVQVGNRFLIASSSPGGPQNLGGTFTSSNVGQIATITNNTPGSITWSFTSPVNNWAVSDLTIGSQHNGASFTYTTSGPYVFIVSSANATAGATYTDSVTGSVFTVTTTISGSVVLLAQGNGVPSASGTLNLTSGTGDSTITFSSYTGSNWIDFAGPGKVAAGSALAYTGNTLNVQYDNSTIGLSGNHLYVLNGGIGTNQLANGAVTYAKIQNVSASRLLGNPTGGSTSASEISLGATLAFSGTALQTAAMTGDITTSANSFATTLATVNGSPGTFAIATLTVNGKGLVTSASAASTTGSGSVVLATSPVLTTPNIGSATTSGLSSTGALLINVNSGASALNIESSNFQRSTDGTNFVTETYVDSITLTNNSGPTAVSNFGFTAGTVAGVEIAYIIENGASPSLVRVGTLRVTASSDGSNPSISDMYTESGDVGVTWTATNSGTTISVNYTATSQTANRTMRADLKQLRY